MQSDNPPFCIRTLPADECTTQLSYEIIWIIKGEGILNTVFFFLPGQQRVSTANAEGYMLSFNEFFISGWEEQFYRFAQSPGVPVMDNMYADMLDVAEGMIKESAYMEMQKSYLHIFLVYIARQFTYIPPQLSVPQHVLFNRFMSLLETRFREKKTVTEYARVLSVTPSYLNEIVKRDSGYSAGHLIRTRIIQEAKRKAVRSDASMKEIAWHLGFSDISHFSKLFKNTTGNSFSEFRKQISGSW